MLTLIQSHDVGRSSKLKRLDRNLDFSQLLEEKVYEFAFIFAAVPMRGATGSPARPIAVQ